MTLVFGSVGNDTLVGGVGIDTIYGSSGNDKLIGGAGADHLFGDRGSDTFIFNTPPKLGIDRIWYFSSADDTIVLENGVYVCLPKGALRKGVFEVNTDGQAHKHTSHIIYNTSNNTLVYDVDGVGGSGGVVFAKFSTYGFENTIVTADDFWIV